ncbi:MAG: DUF1846 family protein, partial [Alphaproteobacteria bacterium]|nr:DUF1846 family protein [Alphaproteobacteria bacterium]
MKNGFDSDRFKPAQKKQIRKSKARNGYDFLLLEVGGKPTRDNNSERSFPGYRPGLKLEVIKGEFPNDETEAVCVISANAITTERKRNDTEASYSSEAFSLIDDFKNQGLTINKVIIARNDPHNKSKKIEKFEKEAEYRGLRTFIFNENGCYVPDKRILPGLETTPYIEFDRKNVIVVSPGAGSGKFGFCLSQMYHLMRRGLTPKYIKFETLPVAKVRPDHLINLLYEAVTADIGDKLEVDENAGNATSYKRDKENFKLLEYVRSRFGKEARCLREYKSATSMGVNELKEGIINENVVKAAIVGEIHRRHAYHLLEDGEESAEVKRLDSIVARIPTALKVWM